MQLRQNQIFATRYMLVRKLGEGGFSEVWLANDVKTGIEVALKVYASYGGMDDDGVKVFSTEYSGVFNLNHSNLLRPTYYDVEDNCPYLVMPYVSNGSAKKYIGHMPEEEVWKFVRDVASGLAYMHSLEPPIIHQDIKPDNVLISRRGTYQITDFGISVKARSTLRKSAMASGIKSGGTTAYMGPERFGKDPLPVKASDIWSLGATVFELMEGYAPFGEMGGLMQKSGAEIPNFQNDYSEKLKDLVVACLAPETWDRPWASQLADYAGDMIKGKNPPATWKPEAPQPLSPEPTAKRHWVVTTYLIIQLIGNVIAGIVNGLSDDFGCLTLFVMNVINVAAVIMLLKNVKAGFWIICATEFVNMIMNSIIENDFAFSFVTFVLGVAFMVLIFRIRKDGVSCWKMLRPMKDFKKKF